MKTKKRMQRFLSIFLACIMMLNVPMSVLASEGVQILDASENVELLMADDGSASLEEVILDEQEISGQVSAEEQAADASGAEAGDITITGQTVVDAAEPSAEEKANAENADAENANAENADAENANAGNAGAENANAGNANAENADTATNQYVLPTESAAEASYYVAVTNTEDGKTPATVKSKMAAVSVLEKAAEPMIRSNLSADEVIYGKGDYAQWLSVGVKYQKGTKKTYQWYSNTSQTIEPGTTYYYVVVTNTREGILPISKTSSVAKITSASAKPVITTDLSTEQVAYKIGAQAQPLSVATGSSDDLSVVQQYNELNGKWHGH